VGANGLVACQKTRTPAEKTGTSAPALGRRAQPEDLAALVELDRVCFGRRAWSARAWWEALVDPECVITAVAAGGSVIAATVLVLTPPVASLASLAVHPDHRRRGLGRRLLRDATARARCCSARWLVLEVDRSNRGAVALYRGEGFAAVRRFREDGRWRCEMLRRLGGSHAV
jgi:[ribosomal protein S18]-alanine N-acetyltransferase